MNCPHCDEPLKPNLIYCQNCEQYLPKENIHFHVIKPQNSLLRLFINSVGGLLLLSGIVSLVIMISQLLTGFYLAFIVLCIGLLILFFNSKISYLDCPNCRAENSILLKPKMIKSHCKYCNEKYEFLELEQ